MNNVTLLIGIGWITFLLITGLFEHSVAQNGKVQIVNLSDSGNSEAFQAIKESFSENNPGYDITYLSGETKVEEAGYDRVLFVQEIDGFTNQEVLTVAVIHSGEGDEERSETIVGDLIILNRDQSVEFSNEVGLLVFKVPDTPSPELPAFVRPDWDDNITDVPGGCATDIDAYRRILLTWSEDVGEYIYHGLNAHRVRIYDSFSHYHPREGGFEEFYLVQMVKPGAKIITSERVDLITNPEKVTPDQVGNIIREYELQVGDLVYLPRGVMHRGYGGVLTQVITVPGFIPGAEIGVDHHLRAINERLGIKGEAALPFNEEHSHEAVIR